MMAAIRDEKLNSVMCQFPMNLDMEPTRQMILNYKNVAEAPSFIVQDYQLKMAERTYRDSPNEMTLFKLKQKYQPFSGQDLNTIKFITSSSSTNQYVDPIDVSLMVNYDRIWREIQEEETEIDPETIKEKLYAKAAKFIPSPNEIPPVDEMGGDS